MGWAILLLFLAYWFVVRHGSAQQLFEVIRNELSGFTAIPASGAPSGIIDAGISPTFPGASKAPLGQVSSQPGVLPISIPVSAATPITRGIPVGVLTPRNDPRQYGFRPGAVTGITGANGVPIALPDMVSYMNASRLLGDMFRKYGQSMYSGFTTQPASPPLTPTEQADVAAAQAAVADFVATYTVH